MEIQRSDKGAGKRRARYHSKLYVNGAYQGESDIGRLMHDFRCCDAKDMYFKEMQEITHHFKETEEGVEFMCRVCEETRTVVACQRQLSAAVPLKINAINGGTQL